MRASPLQKPRHYPSEDERQEMIRRLRRRDKSADIAEEFNVTISVVAKLARKHGIVLMPGKGMLKPEAADLPCGPAKGNAFYASGPEEIRRLRREKGLARYQIAAILRIPYAEVEKALENVPDENAR